jgi:hypothetical protein
VVSLPKYLKTREKLLLNQIRGIKKYPSLWLLLNMYENSIAGNHPTNQILQLKSLPQCCHFEGTCRAV